MSHAAQKRKIVYRAPKPHRTTCPSCGKQSYKTEGEALVGALNSSAAKGKPFRVYPCATTSGAWHTTSQVGRRAEFWESWAKTAT